MDIDQCHTLIKPLTIRISAIIIHPENLLFWQILQTWCSLARWCRMKDQWITTHYDIDAWHTNNFINYCDLLYMIMIFLQMNILILDCLNGCQNSNFLQSNWSQNLVQILFKKLLYIAFFNKFVSKRIILCSKKRS